MSGSHDSKERELLLPDPSQQQGVNAPDEKPQHTRDMAHDDFELGGGRWDQEAESLERQNLKKLSQPDTDWPLISHENPKPVQRCSG